MKKSFDLISVGDTAFDIFLELSKEVKVLKDPKTKVEYLGLVNAEKITVDKLTNVPAVGNAPNVAIGVSRLGLKAGLYTIVGDDEVGEESLEIFKREKVAIDYVVIDKKLGSNTSVVLNHKAERTILVYHEKRDYSLPKLAATKWMYFTSLAEGHNKLHKQIPQYVQKHKVKLGFNPGSHQMHEGIKKMRPILAVTTVLFVNRDEAQTLVGKSKDIKELFYRLHKEGPKIVAITIGPKGSYASDGKKLYFLDIFPAPLVERTGAGDSFATGFISSLVLGHTVPEAMRWGTINSASVIQKIGARAGLLTKKEMESTLKKNKKFQAKKI